MKPIKLKIAGINSFIEEETIDFQTLSENGLFGVFGPTGSGKSTIIDAMTLALYGEMSRFDGSRSKEFINTNCDEASIKFEFEVIYNGEPTRFLIDRLYKKSDTGSSLNAKSTLASKDGDGEISVICDMPSQMSREIEEILGLNYSDFSRSVVLPQGKFMDFLLLKNIERKDMLERIFGLERYGDQITNVVRKRDRDNNNELQKIDNKLSLYGDITKKVLDENKEKLNELEKDIENKKEIQKEENKKKDELKTTLDNYNNLLKYNNEKEEILKEEENINHIKILDKDGDKASLIKDNYNKKISYEKEIEKINKDLKEIEPEIKKTKELKKEIDEKYLEIKKSRDEEIPVLTEERIKIENGIKLENENKENIKKEKDRIDNKDKGKGIIKDLEEKIGKIEKKIDEYKTNLEKKEEKIKKYTISTDIRQKSERANNLYIRKEEIEKSIKDIDESILGLNKDIKEKEENLKLFEIKLNKKTDTNTKLKENIERLKPEKENSEILELKEKNINNKSLFENSIKEYDEYLKLIEKIKLNNEKIKELEENHKKTKDEEIVINKRIKEIKTNIKNMENMNMASILAETLKDNEACPVCGSLEHPQIAEKISDLVFNKLREDEKTFEEKLKACVEKLNREKVELDIILNTTKEDNEKLKSLEKYRVFDREKEEELIKNREIEIKKYEENFKEYEKTKEKLNKDKEELDKEINTLDKQIGIEKENIKNQNKNLKSKNKEKEESNKNINNINIELEELSKILKTDKFKENYLEILEKEEKKNNIDIEIKKIREETEEINGVYNKEKENLVEANTKLVKLIASIEQIRESIDKNIKALEIFKDKDLEILLKNTSDKINKINNEYKELEEKKESTNESLDKLLKEKGEKKSSLETYNKLYIENLEEYKDKLKAEKFNNEEEFLNSILDEEYHKDIKEKIKEYDLKLNNINENIKRVKLNLENKDTKDIENRYNINMEKLKVLDENINEINKDIILLGKKVEEQGENLKKVESLNKEKKEMEKLKENLTVLRKLFEGKKFVDFVSKRYLQNITRDASKRLMDMTGQYELVLEDTEFAVRDLGSGGQIRDPKTLSGGETFMVSLCLALSLSSQIQMKSKSSLEFFFLDEGFGSLDENTLNTVVDSLVKLQSQNIKVGLITHVEDLKNQMPRKLIVSRPIPGIRGTKLEME